MGEDGITNCGNAQNCVQSLPDEHSFDTRNL